MRAQPTILGVGCVAVINGPLAARARRVMRQMPRLVVG